jgi:hypothetical protein
LAPRFAATAAPSTSTARPATDLHRAVGPQALRQVERKLNCYVVVADDGVLITAAPRTARIRH